MPLPGIPVLKSFSVSSIASGTTAAQVVIPPSPGMSDVPYRYNALDTFSPALGNLSYTTTTLKPTWLPAPTCAVTLVPSLHTKSSSTSHTFLILRPLNWTYFPAGLAKNTTAIPDSTATGIASDPGLYATKYFYPTLGGVVPGPAAD